MSEIRGATLGDVAAVSRLHVQRITDGFLASLGPRFLERLYARIVQSQRAFLLVTSGETEAVAGFVAVAEHTSRLYREFLVHDGLRATAAAAPRLARAPRHALETLRYGIVGAHATDPMPGSPLPGAEVLAVAVADSCLGRGIGTALVNAATAELRLRGVPAVRVVTASTNEAALRMYERCGFRREGSVEVHRGIRQDVLVWR